MRIRTADRFQNGEMKKESSSSVYFKTIFVVIFCTHLATYQLLPYGRIMLEGGLFPRVTGWLLYLPKVMLTNVSRNICCLILSLSFLEVRPTYFALHQHEKS